MFYAMSYDTAMHLDPEDLERYSRAQASEEETARFEEHLLRCEPCREELRTVDSFVAAMRVAATDWRRERRLEQDSRRSWWSVPRLAPVFAALAALLLAAVVAPRFTGSLQPPI